MSYEYTPSDGESSVKVDDQDGELALDIFNDVWAKLLKKYGSKKMKFPAKMIWLNGAPGSGKGTNTSSVMRVLELFTKPIEVSSLLNNPEAQAIKASGRLVDDATVIAIVFEELLRPENARGVIIDGFPRTRVQAMCLKLLINRLQADEHNKWCSFKIINFMVSRKTSIERQLARGRETLENNRLVESSHVGSKMPVRETDLSESMANFRYQTYLDQTQRCLMMLCDMVEYDEISAEGSIDEVRKRIYTTLSAND
jgi:adenylate kinase